MSELPTIAERPDASVVIFDGDCRFCQGQVRRLARFDLGKSLAFVSLHDPEVARRYPDLSHEQLMEQMYVVARGSGRRYGGADAFRSRSGDAGRPPGGSAAGHAPTPPHPHRHDDDPEYDTKQVDKDQPR